MGERTVRADLQPPSVLFQILRIARAIFYPVQRTVTKQTIKVSLLTMTGKILTFFIFKITI